MWIQNRNLATRKLYLRDLMDQPVEFSSTGKAQVTRAVGEALIDRCATIEPVETDNSDEGGHDG